MFLFTVVVVFIMNNYAVDLINHDLTSLADMSLNGNFDNVDGAVALMFIGGLPAPRAPSPLEFGRDVAEYSFIGSTSFRIILFFFIALLIVCALVGLNWIIINFRSNNRKNSPYECGFEPVGSPVADFTPNFTSVALIFLIYDVEVLLTFP